MLQSNVDGLDSVPQVIPSLLNFLDGCHGFGGKHSISYMTVTLDMT